MSTEITIGGLDERSQIVANLELPVLEDYEPIAWIEEAIDVAASERMGTVVVGAKGVGKSFGVRQAVETFQSAERAKQEQDATYEKRRILSLQAPRDDRYRDVIARVWQEASGMKMSFRRGMHGKGDDELLYELVEQLLNQNQAVVVLDEAERLTPTGLEAMRDLISAAEDEARSRQSVDGDDPCGVGVVLVGTHELESRLSANKEKGHRWMRTFKVERPSLRVAARYYRCALPCVETFAEEKGEAYWREYVKDGLLEGQRRPIRFLAQHVRLYVRWAATRDGDVASLEDVELDTSLLESAAEEIMEADDGDRED